MERKKHKRKTNHVIIVTSDAVDANVKQYRISPWIVQFMMIVVCIVIGAGIGYIYYESRIWEAASQKFTEKAAAQEEIVSALEAQKKDLETQVASLNMQIEELKSKNSILSETVNQKVQTENELTAQLEKQKLPTEFPLTGSASFTEVVEGDPICIFKASVGTMVVATASGTVTAITDDAEYGHSLWVDHGNGYVTIYRNQSDANVKEGDSVVQGTTLFLIGEDNTSLGYQMMKDGAYINPMDMLVING